MPRYFFSLVDGKHAAEDKYGKELNSLYEAHLHALHMFEKLIQFIPDSLSPTCHIKITSAAGEPVLTVFLPALAAEERFQRVLAHHLQRAQLGRVRASTTRLRQGPGAALISREVVSARVVVPPWISCTARNGGQPARFAPTSAIKKLRTAKQAPPERRRDG